MVTARRPGDFFSVWSPNYTVAIGLSWRDVTLACNKCLNQLIVPSTQHHTPAHSQPDSVDQHAYITRIDSPLYVTDRIKGGPKK